MSDTLSLRELMDERDLRYQQRFEAQSSAIAAALLSSEKAVIKAETANDKRFESVNEFRKTLSDQTQGFVTRAEYSQGRDAILERVGKLESRQDLIAGRSGGVQASWAILVGAVTIAGALGAMLSNILRSHP